MAGNHFKCENRNGGMAIQGISMQTRKKWYFGHFSKISEMASNSHCSPSLVEQDVKLNSGHQSKQCSMLVFLALILPSFCPCLNKFIEGFFFLKAVSDFSTNVIYNNQALTKFFQKSYIFYIINSTNAKQETCEIHKK